MKKHLLSLVLGGLLLFAMSAVALAQPASNRIATRSVDKRLNALGPAWAALASLTGPSVSSIDPTSAPNDLGTPVTITGSSLAAVMDASGTVLTPPTAYLGGVALTGVSWVDSSTLTATVPWGMDPGVYDLTVVNPDGGIGSLPRAFTVTQGLGKWNAGDLFGGEVDQLLMKPGDPNTLYALAYGVVGLFRSRDAGAQWTYVSDRVSINNGKFAIDPLHPGWIYGYAPNGLMVSKDDGDTWSTVTSNPWPGDPSVYSPQVFVSPYEPGVLFVSSFSNYGGGLSSDAYGLVKSADGGVSWHVDASMDGTPVQEIAFDPVDSHRVALATSDARVFLSGDGGDTWTEVAKPPVSGLGLRASLRYNPYKSGELWLDSFTTGGGIFKSTDASITGWQDVSPAPGNGSASISFAGAESVYVPRFRTADGGVTWTPFGPSPWYGYGSVLVDSEDTSTIYIGDDEMGVRKSTDGGTGWETKNTGLTGLCCTSMDVSRADPLRVWAAFNGPLGVYRSDDGTNHWSYLHIPGAWNVRQVREDPADPLRVYVAADSGFYVSEDGGDTWTDRGWNATPTAPDGMASATEPDPFQPGHLLSGANSGLYGIGAGVLFSSVDYGVSWQAVSTPALSQITGIAFDPETTGTVYLTTRETGAYKSTAAGVSGSWQRIDDRLQPDMAGAANVAIATHPQHVLIVATNSHYPYRSLDGGATWQKAQNSPGDSSYMFVDADSTRLYGRARGLWSSSDLGESWQQAAGALGQLQVMAMGYADADSHTVLYAATNGGSTVGALAPSSMAFRASLFPLATVPTQPLVGAGVYRYVTRRGAVSYVRTYGTSRYATAVEVSKAMHPGTPTHATKVVIATGQDFPDALCAAPLAAAYDAPLLLWNPLGSNTAVKNEMKRLRIDGAFIVGSSRVVPTSAETDIQNVIKANWGSSGRIVRFAGRNRYETAERVAASVGNRDPSYGAPGWKPSFIVASGRNYPDALSAAPFAAANGMPILLSQPDWLPPETRAALAARGAAGVIVVGSEKAVSSAVYGAIPVVNKRRLYGDNRYETCAAIAEYARTHGASMTHLGFVLGTNFPDALASGPFLAQNDGIAVLTAPTALPFSVSNECGRWKLDINYVNIIGGPNVLPDSTVNQLKSVLGN